MDTKEGRSRSSVDRFKEGLRINSGAQATAEAGAESNPGSSSPSGYSGD
jgi:hypothetical protein